MRVFADVAGQQIDTHLSKRRANQATRRKLERAIADKQMYSAYQPIVDLTSRRTIGLECLTRFGGEPRRGPDAWFKEATSVDYAIPFELHACELGLIAFSAIPSDVYLSINASPVVIESGALLQLSEDLPWGRVLVEVTEHAGIDGYERLRQALEPLRRRGAMVAVDDAGAGYASFKHILDLEPDLIKLDISLTRNIDADRNRRALASAMIRFSEETGIDVIAEGIETTAELDVLMSLGVKKGQGYLLGKPTALGDLKWA
jgi:EAL domain-containing protein (putative c-di-GMP-specific phosphodiesterase class I)